MEKLISVVLAFVMVVSLAACSSGVSQEEYDKVVAERDALEQEVNTLKKESEDYQEKIKELEEERESGAKIVDKRTKKIGDIELIVSTLDDGSAAAYITVDEGNTAMVSRGQDGSCSAFLLGDATFPLMEQVCIVHLWDFIMEHDGSLGLSSGDDYGAYQFVDGKATALIAFPIDKYDDLSEAAKEDETIKDLVTAFDTAINYIELGPDAFDVKAEEPAEPEETIQNEILYQDDYVTIAFVEIKKSNGLYESTAVFQVTNKTGYELTFQSDAISFNGTSYEVKVGSDKVAPNSTGKVEFDFEENIPDNVTSSSGTIRVIDFSRELLQPSYDAKWIKE